MRFGVLGPVTASRSRGRGDTGEVRPSAVERGAPIRGLSLIIDDTRTVPEFITGH